MGRSFFRTVPVKITCYNYRTVRVLDIMFFLCHNIVIHSIAFYFIIMNIRNQFPVFYSVCRKTKFSSFRNFCGTIQRIMHICISHMRIKPSHQIFICNLKHFGILRKSYTSVNYQHCKNKNQTFHITIPFLYQMGQDM